MSKSIIALLSSFLVLEACTSTTPTKSLVESEFGNSVRQMRDAQTLDRATLTNPSDEPVVGADAYVVTKAVEEMRKDKPNRGEAAPSVLINLGNGQVR